MVFISHDRYFINRLATKVVEVRNGRLVTHLGGYDEYHAATERPPAALTTQGREPPEARTDHVRRERERRPAAPARGRDDRPSEAAAGAEPALRELRRRLDALETEIHAVEARLQDLGRALADPALYVDGARARAVSIERQAAEEQVAWLLREWETLSEALAARG